MSVFEDLPKKLGEALPEEDASPESKKNKSMFRSVGGFAKSIGLKNSNSKDSLTEAVSPTKETTTVSSTEEDDAEKEKSMFRSVGGFAKSIGLKKDSSSKDNLSDAVTTVSKDDEGVEGIDMEIPDDAELDPDNFTEEEIKAARETKAMLLDPTGPHKMEAEEVTARELMLVVCNCKLRPTDAAKKYKRWHDVMKEGTGLQSLAAAFDGIGRNAENLKDDKERVAAALTVFRAQGRDMHDRGIMWIYTHKIPPEEELLAVKNAIVYFTAAHADLKSLRRGMTFVLDTENDNFEASYGNEAKMQRIWQCMPLRPQRIFILGAGMVKRVLINAALALASLFTNEKVKCRTDYYLL